RRNMPRCAVLRWTRSYSLFRRDEAGGFENRLAFRRKYKGDECLSGGTILCPFCQSDGIGGNLIVGVWNRDRQHIVTNLGSHIRDIHNAGVRFAKLNLRYHLFYILFFRDEVSQSPLLEVGSILRSGLAQSLAAVVSHWNLRVRQVEFEPWFGEI